VQQIQRHCSECEGEGFQFQKKKERKVLDVGIEKGMRHNQKIVFAGMADEKPNMEAGDINFVVQEKDHDVFKRKGADLLITKSLSLNEALTGFAWKIQHLDGREVVIQSSPGEVIPAEDEGGRPFVKIVPNEGMPSHGNPFVKGNLYVLFTVKFPKDGDLSPEAAAAIKKFLPTPAMDIEYDPETAEIVHLDHADVKQFGKGGLTQSDGNESDEDGDGQQGVQCNQS
jgi:DnaJ family protein A protein 2